MNSTVRGNFQFSSYLQTFIVWFSLHRVDIGIRIRHEDFNNSNSQPDFIYCMMGRFSCCGDDVGIVGNFKDAHSLCNHQGSRLYTVKSGNITNDILYTDIKPAEFIWTDKGSHKFHTSKTRTSTHLCKFQIGSRNILSLLDPYLRYKTSG